MSDDVEGAIGEAGYGRRTFLRRLAMGSAFAVPVVASFSMAGISAVSAQAGQSNGLISNCNQTISTGNQTIFSGNQGGYGGGGFPGYGRTPTGNIPICDTPHGILGFLENIFSLSTHPLKPI
jgi:hypothetical protein